MTKAPTWGDIGIEFPVVPLPCRNGRYDRWVEVELTPEAWERHAHAIVVGAEAEACDEPGRISHVFPERRTFRVGFP